MTFLLPVCLLTLQNIAMRWNLHMKFDVAIEYFLNKIVCLVCMVLAIGMYTKSDKS